MSRPLFSVVLPTYNRASMLRAALRSVQAQIFTDFECFVLDDGSRDDTPKVFEEFRADRRLLFHRFDDNRRQHVRRNFAIEKSRGEFVTFLDSDDLWLPRRLERFTEAISARPSAGFWFSNAYHLRYGRIIGTVFDPRRAIPEGRVPGWYAVGDRFLPYLTSNLAVRREAFEKIGRFREDMKILEDTELYARMLASGLEVGVLREPLAVRRLHEAQITHDHEVDFRESLMALEAGSAPPELVAAERRRLARASACYLWKGLKPAEARALLSREMGWRAWISPLFYLSRLPPQPLAWLKGLRRLWLMARHHPALAGEDLKAVHAFLRDTGA